MNEMFMTSPIGDLPVNPDGMRKAIDEIARLQSIVQNAVISKPIEMQSPIGTLTVDAAGLRTAIDEIARCHAKIDKLKLRLNKIPMLSNNT